MTASEIRALFAVANRPEVVSLAGGMPYIAALPLDVVGECSATLVAERRRRRPAVRLRPGRPDAARADLRGDGARGHPRHPDDVVVTVGSQQALDLVTRIFVDPGDVVLAEAPTYVGALGTFRAYQAEVVHVAMDDDGLSRRRWPRASTALRAAGRRREVPLHDPDLPEPGRRHALRERRRARCSRSASAGLLVLEDDPYGLLGFDGEPLARAALDDDDGVIYLGSFSKTFAPGLRVGWALAPHAVREKLVLAAEAAMLCPSDVHPVGGARYLATTPWRDQIKTFRELYRERRDAMLEALAHLMPEGDLDRARRRLLRLGSRCPRAWTPRRCCRAPSPPGRLRARHRVLRRRRRSPAAACGCPTASRPPSASARACAASPA